MALKPKLANRVKTRLLGFALIASFVAPALNANLAYGHGGEYQEKLAQELNLTNEQREKLKALFGQHRDDHATRRQTMKAARKELQAALRSDQSTDEVRKKFEALKKVQDELESRRFDKILAIRDVLTLEQRQKFKDLEQKHWGHWKFKHRFKNMRKNLGDKQ